VVGLPDVLDGGGLAAEGAGDRVHRLGVFSHAEPLDGRLQALNVIVGAGVEDLLDKRAVLLALAGVPDQLGGALERLAVSGRVAGHPRRPVGHVPLDGAFAAAGLLPQKLLRLRGGLPGGVDRRGPRADVLAVAVLDLAAHLLGPALGPLHRAEGLAHRFRGGVRLLQEIFGGADAGARGGGHRQHRGAGTELVGGKRGRVLRGLLEVPDHVVGRVALARRLGDAQRVVQRKERRTLDGHLVLDLLGGAPGQAALLPPSLAEEGGDDVVALLARLPLKLPVPLGPAPGALEAPVARVRRKLREVDLSLALPGPRGGGAEALAGTVGGPFGRLPEGVVGEAGGVVGLPGGLPDLLKRVVPAAAHRGDGLPCPAAQGHRAEHTHRQHSGGGLQAGLLGPGLKGLRPGVLPRFAGLMPGLFRHGSGSLLCERGGGVSV
jgi:hypothetical protein